jgi:hypothetical protein
MTGMASCTVCKDYVPDAPPPPDARRPVADHETRPQIAIGPTPSPPAPSPTLVRLVPIGKRQGPATKTWAVGIVTAPRKTPTLDRCLASVLAAGWRPRIFAEPDSPIPKYDGPITQRTERLGAWSNHYLALHELAQREPRADAYVMLQDDAILAPDLRAYLESALWPGWPLGACSLYCSKAYDRGQAGWTAFAGKWVWGAVAFVWPRESLWSYLTSGCAIRHTHDLYDKSSKKSQYKVDIRIGKWSHGTKGMPIYYPQPSLVQHIGATSSIWTASGAVGKRRAARFAGDLMTGGQTT